MNKIVRTRLLPAIVAAAAWLPALGWAQADAIDPMALKLLQRSTDYLAGLKTLSVDANASLDLVIANGQKLKFDQHNVITVQRPNKLRAQRVGEIVGQTFVYDGKSLSVNLPEEGFYATTPAPDTLEAALDFARDSLKIIAPAADLLHKNAYELLTSGLTAAYIVGEATVAGVRCDHVAFRNAEVDWQICIEQGTKPLPRKFIITSKKMPQSPEFVVVMNRWDVAPRLNAATFRFQPSKGATKIDFVTAGQK